MSRTIKNTTIVGTLGGTTGIGINNFPATLETFLVANGSSQTGTVYNLPSGRATIQSVANGTSGAFTSTTEIYVSNDGTNFILSGTITLSGTATTADTEGIAINAPWAYIRVNETSLTGTGASNTVTLSV